jgi:hypothetical protein
MELCSKEKKTYIKLTFLLAKHKRGKVFSKFLPTSLCITIKPKRCEVEPAVTSVDPDENMEHDLI